MGGGTSRKVKRVYLGVNNVSHKVKKGYIGDESGKARLFYSNGRVWKKYFATPNYTYYWNRYDTILQYSWDKCEVTSNITQTSLGRRYTIYTDGFWTTSHQRYEPFFGFSNGKFYLTGGTFTYDNDDHNGYFIQEGHEEVLYYSPGGIRSYGGGASGDRYYQLGDSGNIRFTGTEAAGTVIETVTSENSSEYPNNGQSGGYWYRYTGSERLRDPQDTTPTQISASSKNQYPSDGISGSYYYIYDRRSVTSYSQGSYISDVEADPGTYPENGRHTDGYWYVLQPE